MTIEDVNVDFAGSTIENIFMSNKKTATLSFSDNRTAILDLESNKIENFRENTAGLSGSIIVMRRHRLADIVCNCQGKVMLVVDHKVIYESKHKFLIKYSFV